MPINLFKHYSRKYDQEYLKNQYYFNPHPTRTEITQSSIIWKKSYGKNKNSYNRSNWIYRTAAEK
ncbi:MAG: YbgA family protein [Desulfobacteraceae bacterium]|nr:YbgA family protein [Desulfobacteraceae bacterium]